jgi:hypothetical protein
MATFHSPDGQTTDEVFDLRRLFDMSMIGQYTVKARVRSSIPFVPTAHAACKVTIQQPAGEPIWLAGNH